MTSERGKFWNEEVAREVSFREQMEKIVAASKKPSGPQTSTYIFHVIGTLTMGHVKNACESVKRQKAPFHWERCVLYNGSPLDTDEILSHMPLDRFDKWKVFPYNPATPKGAIADWDVHMRMIDGTDRYFCHKADFYLSEKAFGNLGRLQNPDFFVLFKKVDMKERSTILDIRPMAKVSWDDIKADPRIGRFPLPGVPENEHIGKLGVIWDGYPLDGTMHAYSDSFRAAWRATGEELTSHHIWFQSFYDIFTDFPFLILNDNFFALHQFHYVPEKADPVKQIPGERF